MKGKFFNFIYVAQKVHKNCIFLSFLLYFLPLYSIILTKIHGRSCALHKKNEQFFLFAVEILKEENNMKKMARRSVSILLSLLMLVSVFSAGTITSTPAASGVTVYYYNTTTNMYTVGIYN